MKNACLPGYDPEAVNGKSVSGQFGEARRDESEADARRRKRVLCPRKTQQLVGGVNLTLAHARCSAVCGAIALIWTCYAQGMELETYSDVERRIVRGGPALLRKHSSAVRSIENHLDTLRRGRGSAASRSVEYFRLLGGIEFLAVGLRHHSYAIRRKAARAIGESRTAVGAALLARALEDEARALEVASHGRRAGGEDTIAKLTYWRLVARMLQEYLHSEAPMTSLGEENLSAEAKRLNHELRLSLRKQLEQRSAGQVAELRKALGILEGGEGSVPAAD